MDYKTEVQDDAGKHAKFDDEFVLENIDGPVKEGLSLEMKAFDKDLVSSDLLGCANPISFIKLVEDNKEKSFDVDIFHEYKKTGNIKFTTKFIWMKPDPPANPLLNPNCRLNLIIVSATFLKDADLIGKQDPYIRFAYNGKKVETDVKDGAGKSAEWNEKFCLTEV
jgi:Ca2+-dependent lipid-binding protein